MIEMKMSWCAVCGKCQGTVQTVRKHLLEKHYEWVKLHYPDGKIPPEFFE